MKLTKVDGIYHSKEKTEGELKSNKKKININHNHCSKEKTKIIVKKRFEAQIESRIYKEFITIKGKKRMNSKSEYIDLYLFLKMLYISAIKGKIEENKYIDKSKLANLDLEKLNKDKNIIVRYKLNKDNYLVRNKDTNEESDSFIKMFSEVQNELKENGKEKKFSELESYQKLQKSFDTYVNTKIDYIVKSLVNNKISVKSVENKLTIIDNKSFKNKFYLELIEKCKEKPTEDILGEQCNIFMKYLDKNIEDIVNMINSKEDVMVRRKNILEKVRKNEEENLSNEEYEYDRMGRELFKLELKDFISNITSHSKREFKRRNGKEDKKGELYSNYLKKELGAKEKLIETIKANFKNRFLSRVLEYGKYLHYLNGEAVTTEELEFIKAKESLSIKMSTVVSFAIHSYNKLAKDNTPVEKLCEKVGKSKIGKEEKNQVDPLKLKYFMKNIGDIDYILEGIHKSLIEFRKKVVHKESSKNSNKIPNVKEEIYTELKKEVQKYLDGITTNIFEKFSSNNIEYYYTKEEIKKYFETYRFKLLKTKIPYAPNFKRIIEKGQKLYENNKEDYGYFFFFKNDMDRLEEKKAYINSKNFLLKELYYNNFFEEFLYNKKGLFKEAVEKAKERKSESSYGKNKSSGTSYMQFENYNEKKLVAEYVANIHKLEMDKLAEERFVDKKVKEKSKYINEYLEDIFLEGFIKWLNDNSLYFLSKKLEIENISKDIKEEEKKYSIIVNRNIIDLSKIKDQKKIVMIFWLLNLVDDKRVSEFANEILKYEQYLLKKTEKEKKFLNIDIKIWREICELVLITRERISLKENEIVKNEKGDNNHLVTKYYSSKEEYFKVIGKFIEEDVMKESKEITNDSDLLYHNGDGETPILYGNLEKTRKFGLNDLIDNMGYTKYTLEEREKYKEINSEIEELQKEKAKLHSKWEQKEKIAKDEYKKYKENCEKIRKYDYLRKKQTMYIPFQIHEIASDIQARFLGYIFKRERDFEFFKTCFNIRKRDEKSNELEENYINDIYEKNVILNLFNKKSYEIRNYIAHFHHYIDKDENGNKTAHSFIEQMNLLIKFLEYDKKLKNHINKSLKTVLEKYNIDITFKRVDDEKFKYVIDKIASKKGKMLGKNNEFQILEEDFIKEVEKMLNYKGKE